MSDEPSYQRELLRAFLERLSCLIHVLSQRLSPPGSNLSRREFRPDLYLYCIVIVGAEMRGRRVDGRENRCVSHDNFGSQVGQTGWVGGR